MTPLLLLALGGAAPQSAIEPHGVEASRIGGLFDVFVWLLTAIWMGVVIWLAVAIWRGRRAAERHTPVGDERAWKVALIAFASGTAAILAALSLATWLTDRGLARAEAAGPALDIELIGHQWWWEVRYRDPESDRSVRTANELHLPVGRPAKLTLHASDVIHSFWAPNLAGKRDLIPGRQSDVVLIPTQVGSFRAQCAEFCGLEHAKMALDITVQPPAAFAAWYEAQLKPPPAPVGAAAQGLALFETRQCSSCHSVSRTRASGLVAPDLSHVASRKTIAAGALAMSHAGLSAWIADPQKSKPGANMPKVPLSPAEREAIVAYLETLK